MIIILLICLLLVDLSLVDGSACHNNCNNHGVCNKWLMCECLDGYSGSDCSLKACPTGPQLQGIPYSKDAAHADAECSGQGTCDYRTGLCSCRPGYTGYNCARTSCFNDCNGRGKCMSLGNAATYNDGYEFNRTTTYTQWDADVFYGCVCDFGWSGADCSLRTCEYGLDPRLSEQKHETVTLVCDCLAGNCKGKFKLMYKGNVIDSWLKPTSKFSDVAAAVMKAPGMYTNYSGHVFVPVTAVNSTAAPNGQICQDSTIMRTKIYFRRSAGDLPSLSFYANLITNGQLYFETTQTLYCDCTNSLCDGSFRLSFDGEVSSKLSMSADGMAVAAALQSMNTIASAGISLGGSPSSSICTAGSKTNHTITFAAQYGNVPRLVLYSSIVPHNNPKYYSSNDTGSVLKLITDDGRDDHVKLCNGIGACNFALATCKCPFGWEFNADLGYCSELTIKTSKYAGLARCPGVVAPNYRPGSESEDGRANYNPRVYVSINPTWTKVDGPVSQGPHNMSTSGIYWFYWLSDTLLGPKFDTSSKTLLVNLTSNSSAGPLILDQTKDRLFYVDMNPLGMHIGIADLRPDTSGNYTVWLSVSYKIFGLAFDAHYKRRNLYWSAPNVYGTDDGKIYYANVDSGSPVVYTLSSTVGQANVWDPHGIAIHYKQKKLYWVDRCNLTTKHSVLRSCDLDGSNYKQVYIYRKIDNHTVSTNLTDLVIDFQSNNTAFFIDAGRIGGILATNLDSPVIYNNETAAFDQFVNYYPNHAVTDTWSITMNTPKYLSLDEQNDLILWSDPALKEVNFVRYIERYLDIFSPGNAFTAPAEKGKMEWPIPYYVVGMQFDVGLGAPQWGPYVECYGNGVCQGLAGNFECKCNKGFFGDCQARTCPTGRAWFHEPVVDEMAHDVYMECSNMGVCDRGTGICTCRAGYEGPACERMACPVAMDATCSNNGRCMTLREMAKHNKNQYLENSPVGYGTVPNDQASWDADMIQGCIADEYGYFQNSEINITTPVGSALSVNECPKGYNTRLLEKLYTVNSVLIRNFTQHLEVQELYCQMNFGNFTFEFRGQTSGTIYWNSTAEHLKRVLQAVPTIGKVKVSMDGPDHICSYNYPQAVNITFLSEFGSVPLLKIYTNSTTPNSNLVTLKRVQTGNTVGLMECSGHGDCDRGTGRCVCWPNYISSDGMGSIGDRGDCGFHINSV